MKPMTTIPRESANASQITDDPASTRLNPTRSPPTTTVAASRPRWAGLRAASSCAATTATTMPIATANATQDSGPGANA